MATNLPAETSSFIGREQVIVEVVRLLATTRLLTLTGPGGVGKTRLALRVAGEVAAGYCDGAWLVELAALRDGGLIPRTVAAVFGLQEDAGGQLAGILEYLTSQRLLLVLDNCEHLINHLTDFVMQLLKACPSVAVITTSRETLNVPGELAWLVPSLSLPDHEPPDSVEELGQYEAIRLFLERGAAARPGFSLIEENAATVAQVCRRLDGIPLAIELAAARTRALAIENIASRLDDRFSLLSGSGRGAVPRHLTLRSSIDWSYDLLLKEEQALFRRLAVFAGGWTLEAAETVCADEQVTPNDVLGLLSSLVDKSLVQARHSGAAVRYRLLETLRAYALEKLDQAGETAALGDRHLSWCLEVAESLTPEDQGPITNIWTRRIAGELDNLRAAFEWCKGEPVRAATGLRMAWALHRFLFAQGYMTEGRQLIADLLAIDPGPGEDEASWRQWARARSQALVTAGMLIMQQDLEASGPALDESISLARQTKEPRDLAFALTFKGMQLERMANAEAAIPILEEGVALARQLDNSWAMNASIQALAAAVSRIGDLDRARELTLEVLGISRALEEGWYTRSSLRNLALLEVERGDLAAAQAAITESLVMAQIGRGEGGQDRAGGPQNLTAAAILLAAKGQHEEALTVAAAAASLRQLIHANLLTLLQSPIERRMAASRLTLSEATAARAQSRGEIMSQEEANAYALECLARKPERPAGILTTRERQVSALLGRGMTNREVADWLVITEGTVKSHVEHILNKLGMASRAQIAAWATKEGLVEAVPADVHSH